MMNTSMNDDWVLALASSDKFDMELKKKRLSDHGILCVLFNHQDSMVKSLNDTDYEVGLYVHHTQLDKAKELLAKN